MNQFSISINSAYAIFDSKLLTWIPKSENIYYDSFDFISSNPIKFDNLGSKKVSKIFCNNQICHIITDEGLIYSWGNDREKYGILGLGNNYNVTLPTLNTNFFLKKRIIDFSLSEKHCVALDISNNLYSWGYGPYGELGLGKDKISFNLPQLVNDKVNITPINVKCGFSYTLIEDYDKSLIYFGIISSKENLDLIYNKNCNDDNFINYIPFDEENGKKNKKIICGMSMVALIDINGNLYVYKDYEGLFLIQIPYSVKSVKIIHNSIYALINDYNVIYEFQPQNNNNCSIFDYTEHLYNIINDIDYIDLIDTPYYDNVLFFTIRTSEEYVDKIKERNLKIFNQIKLNGKNNSSINIFNSDESKFSSTFNNDSIVNQPNTFIINKNEKNRNNIESNQRISKISKLLNQLFNKSINDIKNNTSYSIPNQNKIKLLQIINGMNLLSNGSINNLKSTSSSFNKLYNSRVKSSNEKNLNRFYLKKDYKFINNSNINVLTSGNFKNMNSFRKSLTKFINNDLYKTNSIDENGINIRSYSSCNFYQSEEKNNEKLFDDNISSIKKFNVCESVEIKENIIEENRLFTFQNGNEEKNNQIIDNKKKSFDINNRVNNNKIKLNKYINKSDKNIVKNNNYEMNDENKLNLNINENINSNEKISPRRNKFSTIKEVNSNINEDKNSSFKKTLSNGMDKLIKNNERYNNIKNINGKENNISNENKNIKKNKKNILITPKKLYSTNSFTELVNNTKLLNERNKTKHLINKYINTNSNENNSDLFKKIFINKTLENDSDSSINSRNNLTNTNLEENKIKDHYNLINNTDTNSNQIERIYYQKKKTITTFQIKNKNSNNKINDNTTKEFDSIDDSNEIKTTEKINNTRASTNILSRPTSEKVSKNDLINYEEKIKSNKIIKRAFSHGKSIFSNHNKNNINNNNLISYVSNEKISSILSENNNLSSKDFSNGNSTFNFNDSQSNLTNHILYKHKNILGQNNTRNRNKNKNKSDTHLINFHSINKKNEPTKKYIKKIPINNNILKTREHLNKFLIKIKDNKNNQNQSENIIDNKINDEPIKITIEKDNSNENKNNDSKNSINNTLNNNKSPENKNIKNKFIISNINKIEFHSKISLSKKFNDIEKDIKIYIEKNMFNKKQFGSLIPTDSPKIPIKPILLDYNHTTLSNIGEPLELEKSSRLSSNSNNNSKGENIKNTKLCNYQK